MGWKRKTVDPVSMDAKKVRLEARTKGDASTDVLTCQTNSNKFKQIQTDSKTSVEPTMAIKNSQGFPCKTPS